MPMGVPGWPDCAFWTASMQRVRIVLTHSRSSSFGSVCAMRKLSRGDQVRDGRPPASRLAPPTNSEANRTPPRRLPQGTRGRPWRLRTGTMVARCSATRRARSDIDARPRPSISAHWTTPVSSGAPAEVLRVSGSGSRRRLERGLVVSDEVPDALQNDVGGRISAHFGGVVRVVTLAGEDRGDAVGPGGLDGGAEPRLVVDEHVVVGGVAPLDVVQLALLVDIDEHVALDRLEQPGAMDLQGLEHHVAVGEDDRLAPLLRVLHGVQGAREQAVRERIVHEKRRDRDEVGAMWILQTEALQRAQVVGVPELLPELLEQLPVPLVLRLTDRPLEVTTHVGNDVIVVDERVVDVEQGDDGHAISPQNRAALVQTILRRSSSGTSANSVSITRREYGQSLP